MWSCMVQRRYIGQILINCIDPLVASDFAINMRKIRMTPWLYWKQICCCLVPWPSLRHHCRSWCSVSWCSARRACSSSAAADTVWMSSQWSAEEIAISRCDSWKNKSSDLLISNYSHIRWKLCSAMAKNACSSFAEVMPQTHTWELQTVHVDASTATNQPVEHPKLLSTSSSNQNMTKSFFCTLCIQWSAYRAWAGARALTPGSKGR